MKTKNVPKVLICKINHNFFPTNMGFPNRGKGGPRLGKNSHIFPFFVAYVPKCDLGVELAIYAQYQCHHHVELCSPKVTLTQPGPMNPSNLFPSTAAIFKVDIFTTVMGMLLKAALSNGSFVLESVESEN